MSSKVYDPVCLFVFVCFSPVDRKPGYELAILKSCPSCFTDGSVACF